jgi:predicted CXXCH cytochrome family protein
MIKIINIICHCLTLGCLRWKTAFVVLLCVFLGAVMIAPPKQAMAARFEILTPQPGATIIARNAETHLVLRQALSGKSNIVRVRKSGSVIKPIVLSEGDEYEFVHFVLPLESGKNTFRIEPDGPQIEFFYKPVQTSVGLKNALTQNVSLFHQEQALPASCQDCHELLETVALSPVGLTTATSCAACHRNTLEKGTWRHSTTVNQQCLACHQQAVEPIKIGFPAENVSEFCFGCHTGKRVWSSRKFIHGPLNIGGCTLCHNPHGENHRYQLIEEGSLRLCLTCHGDKEGLVAEKTADRMPYVHGIVAGEGCVICHDPHATDQQFMLKKPINQLCSGCHPGIAAQTGGHPLPNHPVAAPRERLRPGRELSCSSCHDPHGSINPLMLIQSPLGGRLCRECHGR